MHVLRMPLILSRKEQGNVGDRKWERCSQAFKRAGRPRVWHSAGTQRLGSHLRSRASGCTHPARDRGRELESRNTWCTPHTEKKFKWQPPTYLDESHLLYRKSLTAFHFIAPRLSSHVADNGVMGQLSPGLSFPHSTQTSGHCDQGEAGYPLSTTQLTSLPVTLPCDRWILLCLDFLSYCV